MIEAEVEAVVDTAGVDPTEAEPVAPAVETSVIGHTVVETATVEITTEGDPAGQSVTVGAQLVMVTSLVALIVEVVMGVSPSPADTEIDDSEPALAVTPADSDTEMAESVCKAFPDEQ